MTIRMFDVGIGEHGSRLFIIMIKGANAWMFRKVLYQIKSDESIFVYMLEGIMGVISNGKKRREEKRRKEKRGGEGDITLPR